MSHDKIHTIIIEKLITGGYGLGRLPDGLVVHVPYVIPGEQVTVKIVRKHKKFSGATLNEVLTPSAWRIKPRCEHFGICGGCKLQHIDYEKQVFYKGEILFDNVLRADVCKQTELHNVFSLPLGALNPYHYRMRIRLHVDSLKKRFGYFQQQSHIVEPIVQCPIASPLINEVLQLLPQSLPFSHLLSQMNSFEITESPENGAVVLSLSLKRKPRARDKEAALAVAKSVAKVMCLYLEHRGGISGPFGAVAEKEEFYIRFAVGQEEHGRKLHFTQEASGFIQVNPHQNEQLIALLLEWAGGISGSRILDLFCGMGNFSLPLALHAMHVTGMDLQRSAIRSARRNAANNYLDNCIFIQRSAEQGIAELIKKKEKFDLVLLDPPRQGCKEVVPYLLEMGPEIVIYISCDPATLARDLSLLTAAKYQLEKMQMVDMFPQTHHLETICLLRR